MAREHLEKLGIFSQNEHFFLKLPDNQPKKIAQYEKIFLNFGEKYKL